MYFYTPIVFKNFREIGLLKKKTLYDEYSKMNQVSKSHQRKKKKTHCFLNLREEFLKFLLTFSRLISLEMSEEDKIRNQII